ncbi:MAG TPA: extracellular solute-binding protein [Thermotogota bacterium]|nr:extracellular solute-binding protein [Thermotogota bacterium]HPJ89373.1 extracellular solute-binding protein [Thermotogota bacterium]HPR97111.1 extracellular solute-binding protein [Thermotogota bacterium]
MKKFVVVLLFLLTVATLYFGKNIEIVYWTHTDTARTELENRLIEEFEAKYPNVTIKRVYNEAKKMGDLVLTAFSGNNGPDIFNLQSEQLFSYMINGRVSPVDFKALGLKDEEALEGEYSKGTFNPVTYDGEIYGIPLELTNWCIYINKKLFRDAGLDPETDYPKTWEDMLVLADKLVQRNGEIITRRPFDFRYPYYLVSLLPMVQQLGGDLVSPDGKTAIYNEEAWLKVLNYFKEWGMHGKNYGNPTYTNARKVWNKDNGDIVMCLTGLYQQGRLRTDNLEFFNSDDWMIVPFPVFEDAVNDNGAAYYGQYWMVNAQASKDTQEWSWKFIDYMRQHAEEYLADVNLMQPINSLLESDLFKSMPYSDVFTKDLEKSNPVFVHENGKMMEEKIGVAIQAVMLSGTDPEEALEQLKADIQEILDDSY